VLKGSDAPPEARLLPIIGDVNGLDVERIIALHPDLVVTWPYTTPGQVALLRARGIAVFTTDAHRVDDIARDLERSARWPARRMSPAAARRYSPTCRRARAPAPRPQARARVLPGLERADLHHRRRHLIDRALRDCGGVNVFADARIPAPQVDVEAVLARRPT
jgi:ABC-type Fe3+-hydroxamate transport system substrate-binding protein